ncbi:MAG: acyl-CoA dehydrogenase family protein, partial [Burkholderiaceae bacterium]|nr:acyl-CoA dehydrogenase family protein [Burkholderiaceae bacterium]
RAQLEQSDLGGWKLSVESSVVPWGLQSANLLLLAVRGTSGLALVTLETRPEFFKPGRSAAGEPRDKLLLDGLELGKGQVHPVDGSLGTQLLLVGALARCHQMAGAMEWALEQTLIYARDRAQFGKPIGGFQAVQHLIAEMAAQVHAAAMATDMARMRLEGPGMETAVAVAKARVGEAAGMVAAIAHQVHGAMGYSQEYPLHYRTRRLWSWREEFGSERGWQLRMGRKVAAAGGKAFWPGLTVVS